MDILNKLYETIMQYIQPGLMILIPVLFGIGVILKKSKYVSDNLIPLILMCIGIVLSLVALMMTTPVVSYMDVCVLIFNSICQGVLTAAGAVFINQMIKQLKKKKPEENSDTTTETK